MPGTIPLQAVRALAEVYSQAELEGFRADAVAALLAEKGYVILNSAQLEGRSGSGTVVQGQPAYVLGLVQGALDWLAAGGMAPAMSAHVSFAGRAVGT